MTLFDIHTITQIVLVAVVGGLVGLDRTAAGQFMISQPIVAGPLAGWMLGDVHAGLIIGAALELVWVLDMPVGTFVPADSTIAAISATAISVLGSRGGSATPDLIGFSVLLTTAMAPVTMMADGIIRKRNALLADRAAAAPGEDAEQRLTRAHLSGLMVFFLKSFVLYLVFLPAGLAAVLVLEYLPERVHAAAALFVKLLPLLGAALVVRKLSIKTLDLFLLAGFLSAAVLGLLLSVPVLVITLFVATAGWLGGRYSERRA